MKLLAIRLDNVRRFTDPVEITGIGSGLNVLTAPNESGKSTFFDALHALFFKSHRSWDKEVASLAPHAGGDPEVAVELELCDSLFRVEKRWSKARRGEARIFSGGHLIKQADDAEAWLAEALKPPKDGGPAGLLWVRQGVAGLDDGDASRAARRDLVSSVAGEVEAMTGGRRMDAARDRCRQELERYVTRNGKAKAGGPLKLAEDELSKLELRREGLAAKAIALRAELDRRRDLRRELAGLQDGEEDAARKARLVEAQNNFAEASRHAESLERAIEAEKSKGLETDRAEQKLAALEAALAEAKAAGSALEVAKAQAVTNDERHRKAEAVFAGVRKDYEELGRRAESASDVFRKALRAEASAAATERRTELTIQLARAEVLRAEVERAAADATVGPSDELLDQLETLADELRILRKTRESQAAALTMRYVAGRKHGVAIDGRPISVDDRIAIPDGAILDIDGIGTLTVHPGARTGSDMVAAAETALSDALEAAGEHNLETARARARLRIDAESRRRDVEDQLKAAAPDGIEALRAKIAKLPERVDAEPEMPSANEAQEAENAAKCAFADGHLTLEKARAAVAVTQTAAAGIAAAVESAEARLSRARSALVSYEDAEAERARLATDLGERQTAFEKAIRQREAISAVAPDLHAARAALERARSIIERIEEDRQRIRLALGKLDTAIEMHAAEAVDEELADVEMRLNAARVRLNEITFEVSVLQKLDGALESARATARDRYVEPVLRELKPLIRLLWPEAELRFDADDVLPTALVRAGTEEDFDILSGGTQEQIALLVRLAFARMLAKAGQSAPVILDDAIVYTDDDRIELMFDALTRQAQDLQILVFSCRQKTFRDLGGRSLAISRNEPILIAAQ